MDEAEVGFKFPVLKISFPGQALAIDSEASFGARITVSTEGILLTIWNANTSPPLEIDFPIN